MQNRTFNIHNTFLVNILNTHNQLMSHRQTSRYASLVA
jgi:hypothetical protein